MAATSLILMAIGTADCARKKSRGLITETLIGMSKQGIIFKTSNTVSRSKDNEREMQE